MLWRLGRLGYLILKLTGRPRACGQPQQKQHERNDQTDTGNKSVLCCSKKSRSTGRVCVDSHSSVFQASAKLDRTPSPITDIMDHLATYPRQRKGLMDEKVLHRNHARHCGRSLSTSMEPLVQELPCCQLSITTYHLEFHEKLSV